MNIELFAAATIEKNYFTTLHVTKSKSSPKVKNHFYIHLEL